MSDYFEEIDELTKRNADFDVRKDEVIEEDEEFDIVEIDFDKEDLISEEGKHVKKIMENDK